MDCYVETVRYFVEVSAGLAIPVTAITIESGTNKALEPKQFFNWSLYMPAGQDTSDEGQLVEEVMLVCVKVPEQSKGQSVGKSI